MSKEKLKLRIAKIEEKCFNFCDQFLDEEYKAIVDKLIGKLSRKRPSPLLRGKEEIWAAGIVHAVGQVNFLNDRSFEPYISFDDLNIHFGTKKSSVGNKAADIRNMFKMDRMSNFEFMTSSRKGEHPLYNSVMVNGFIVPVSSLPKEYQELVFKAREKGEDIEFRTE